MQVLNILCLHGLRQDGDMLCNKISRVVDDNRSVANFVFPHAPHLAALVEPGLAENVVERSWYDDHRSFEASAKLFSEMTGTFDVVFGFSQGCSAALQLLADSKKFPCLANLRGIILVASPEVPCDLSDDACNLASLHIIGNEDQIVPPATSVEVSQRFPNALVCFHRGGHSVPQNKPSLGTIQRFLKTLQLPLDVEAFRAQVDEEIQMLQAVFGDFIQVDMQEHTARIQVEISATIDGVADSPVLLIELTSRYPETPAVCSMLRPTEREHNFLRRVNRELNALSQGGAGTPMLFHLISAAATVLEEEKLKTEEDDQAQEATPWSLLDPETMKPIIEAAYDAAESRKSQFHVTTFGKSGGGVMKYVIGLVGKPSAGKSTFFNAITDPQGEAAAAKVGAFPFTTILPNVGDAFFTRECLCEKLGITSTCGAEFGHIPNTSFRRVPVVVKDVAGLVPGAYCGRGKGNQFLNDLCDAHVLIHVIDGSGTSTAGGEVDPDNASKPWEDVLWIRQEIHSWIFDNVAKQWDSIRRKPLKLLSMFTGYQSTLGFMEAVLESTGGKLATLQDDLPRWDAAKLHEFVATYVVNRFPTVLAVNKADHPNTREHVERVKCAFPSMPVQMMAARVEVILLNLRRRGVVDYLTGSLPTWKSDAASPSPEFVASLAHIESHGDTGVAAVLRAAVHCRPAVVVYPVDDFDHCTFEGVKLKRTLMMRPGSTVEDAFRACFPHHKTLVRAEYIKDNEKRIAKKDAAVLSDSLVRFFYR